MKYYQIFKISLFTSFQRTQKLGIKANDGEKNTFFIRVHTLESQGQNFDLLEMKTYFPGLKN